MSGLRLQCVGSGAVRTLAPPRSAAQCCCYTPVELDSTLVQGHSSTELLAIVESVAEVHQSLRVPRVQLDGSRQVHRSAVNVTKLPAQVGGLCHDNVCGSHAFVSLHSHIMTRRLLFAAHLDNGRAKGRFASNNLWQGLCCVVSATAVCAPKGMDVGDHTFWYSAKAAG